MFKGIINLFLIFFITIFSSANGEKVKLNVLLIIADDLNCDISAYGNEKVLTPNIDALAERGVLFGNAHVQYPLCSPSRISMMTGLYPDQTNSKKLRLHLRQSLPEVITIGQTFKMNNYHSVRVGKIYHYHNPRDIGTAGHDDFYTWDQTINPYGRDKLEEHKLNKVKDIFDGATLSWYASDGEDEEQTDGIGASETMELLDKFSKNKENFFLAYGLYRPHIPFVAPKKYFHMYDEQKIEIPSNGDDFLLTVSDPAKKSLRARKEQINLDYNLKKRIKHAYYATTSFVDAQVGRVLEKLKETGLDKNTIVIFTSDHGYHLGEKGHWQKQTLYERSTRVPLIIAGPGLLSNKKDMSTPVELVDIYKTITDLLGFETPLFVQGESLKPILTKAEKINKSSALSELQVYVNGNLAQGYSIKTSRYRLIEWKHKNNTHYEFYDHKFDKIESNNLSNNSSYQSIIESMKIELKKRVKQASLTPKGIGRQIKNAQPTFEPLRIHSQPKSKN